MKNLPIHPHPDSLFPIEMVGSATGREHEFTGIFILAEMQKKASKSGLSVAYSVYFPRTDNAVPDNENSYDSI